MTTYSYTTLIAPSQGSNGSTAPQSINSTGQVLGYYSNGTSTEGFLYSNGIYTNLIDPLQSNFSGANGVTIPQSINSSGQVVGYYYNGTSTEGFLYSNGTYTTIDFPGAQNTDLWGINDAGQIVGTYEIGNTYEGFLASPVPLSGQVVLSITEGETTTGTSLPSPTLISPMRRVASRPR
jgi:probable HAF family extracellular repeat protein